MVDYRFSKNLPPRLMPSDLVQEATPQERWSWRFVEQWVTSLRRKHELLTRQPAGWRIGATKKKVKQNG